MHNASSQLKPEGSRMISQLSEGVWSVVGSTNHHLPLIFRFTHGELILH